MSEPLEDIEATEDTPQTDPTETGPLTDWVKEPTVTELKQDLQDADSSRTDHISKVDTWLDNLNITGSAKVKKRDGKSAIVPKLIRKQAEWRYASLSEPFLSTDDIFNADPVTYEDKAAAIQNGLVLNNQFNTKLDKIAFVDEFVRTAVDEGTVITKVTWDYEEDVEEVEVPTTALVMVNGVPTEVQTGTHMEEQVTVLKNQPNLEICNYNNVTIDPSCQGKISKANFVIYSFETSMAELKRDGKYTNLDGVNVTNSSILSEPDHESPDDSSFNFSDKVRKKIVAYEYWGFWDIDDTGILKPIVSTWIGDIMIRLEENPYPDGKLPFVSVQYLPVRKSIYGEPDGELLEDNQKIVGAVTRGLIDTMGRSANGQVGSRKDALDVTNKRKFDKGLDYEYNGNVDPRVAFHMHTYPEIPRSAEYMLNLQNNEAESLTGVKAFSSTGITGDALGGTVGGQRNALDATAKRELGILRRFAEGMKQIGRKIVSMNAEFLEETEVVRITNEEFVQIRRDDLAGNFDLRLTISTAEADSDKAQELAFMLQTNAANQDPELTKMIQVEIARLRKMPTLAKQIENYQPQPDPVQQKMAELQVQLLEAQVFNERAKGQENTVDVGLKQAKTQTELAKGRNLNSQSDQADLNFLEQESGVNRQHEMDLKEHDRGSKLDLEAAKALLKGEEESKKTKI